MFACSGALLKGDFNGCAYHAFQRPIEPEVHKLPAILQLKWSLLKRGQLHLRCKVVLGNEYSPAVSVLTRVTFVWQLARLLGLFNILAERTAELLHRWAVSLPSWV